MVRPVVPAEASAPATTSALMPPSFAGGPGGSATSLESSTRLVCTCRLAAQAGGPLWQFLQIFGFLYISWNLACTSASVQQWRTNPDLNCFRH